MSCGAKNTGENERRAAMEICQEAEYVRCRINKRDAADRMQP